MVKRSKVLTGSFLAALTSAALMLALVPQSYAATTNASPTPRPSVSATPRTWGGSSATPRASASSVPTSTSTRNTSTASPTPSPTVSVPAIAAVYADTNVPQIQSIEVEKSYTTDLLTVSFLVKVKIHRNTVQSIALEFKPKAATGAPLDPIFQAPCTKVSDVTISAVTPEGNSVALQKRSVSGDWYLEEYVLQSKTKLSRNLGPCPGAYVITGISLNDAAKHTLNIDANLASTAAVVASTSKTPTTPAKVLYTDTAIMQSNIWNSRPDLAPCTAGSNLAPTLTNVVINGKNTQAYVAPTILNTNRVACAPTIALNLASTLFSIAEGEFTNGAVSNDSLQIIDYAAELTRVSGELSRLTSQMSALTAQNALLVEEIARLKAPSPSATPKPSASTSQKPTVTSTKKPTVKSTRTPSQVNRNTTAPRPHSTGGSGGGYSKWQQRKSPTPTPKAKK